MLPLKPPFVTVDENHIYTTPLKTGNCVFFFEYVWNGFLSSLNIFSLCFMQTTRLKEHLFSSLWHHKVKPSVAHSQRTVDSSRDLAAVFHYPRAPCEAEECTDTDESVGLLFWSPSWCHLPWQRSRLLRLRILHVNRHTICSLSPYRNPLMVLLNKQGIYQTFIMISVNDQAA